MRPRVSQRVESRAGREKGEGGSRERRIPGGGVEGQEVRIEGDEGRWDEVEPSSSPPRPRPHHPPCHSHRPKRRRRRRTRGQKVESRTACRHALRARHAHDVRV